MQTSFRSLTRPLSRLAARFGQLVAVLAGGQERRMRRRTADLLLRRDDLDALLRPSRLTIEDLRYWERTGEPRPPRLRVVSRHRATVTRPEDGGRDPASADECAKGRAA